MYTLLASLRFVKLPFKKMVMDRGVTWNSPRHTCERNRLMRRGGGAAAVWVGFMNYEAVMRCRIYSHLSRLVISRLFAYFIPWSVSLRKCFSRYLNDSSLSLFSVTFSIPWSMYILLLLEAVMRDKLSRRRRAIKRSMNFRNCEFLLHAVLLHAVCTVRASSWFVQGSWEAILSRSYACKARVCARTEGMSSFLLELRPRWTCEDINARSSHTHTRGSCEPTEIPSGRSVRLMSGPTNVV